MDLKEIAELKEAVLERVINDVADIINDRCEAELGQVHASSRGGKVIKTVDTKLIAKDIVKYFTEDNVVISREDYKYLKQIEKSFDPFWFCSFGGCEGACKECKDNCEMSHLVQAKQKRTYEIHKWMEDTINVYGPWINRMNTTEANKARVRCVLEAFVADFDKEYEEDIRSQKIKEKCDETVDR